MHRPIDPPSDDLPAAPASPTEPAPATAPAVALPVPGEDRAVDAVARAENAASAAPAITAQALSAVPQREAADVGASPATAAPGAATPVAAPPATPVKVLVIDDELAGLSAAHLRESAQAFVDELADINSPTTAAVWAVVSTLTQKPALAEAKPEEIEAYLASDEFVRRVVLSAELRATNLPHPEMLQGFYDHERGVSELRTMLESAYAAPAFELTFVPARPAAPDQLRGYDLVVLDLVLAGSAAAVDELVDYLATLAKNDALLPGLIILSSRDEMVDNRPRFSTDSNISAAGLLLLEKKHVRQPQFGVTGLLLSHEQLARQRDVAQKIRMFVRAWMSALDKAKKAAGETLWNLDAAAMQEIHLSANSDDDPYDAHLNELVSREYLWHVEGEESVTKTVDALDAAFQGHLKQENDKLVIKERFVAPYADPKPGRTLVSHYNWTGFTPIGRLDQFAEADLIAKFNRFVPFGAVLAPHAMAAGVDCWVHITQQCDLNGAVRVKKGATPDCKDSAMFAVATAVPVRDHAVPDHSTQDLVARGLRVGDQEYDLKLVNGRLISMPIQELIGPLRAKRQVVGRLRHDIATQFLNATANHMTRPAQLKATRTQVRPARLFLWGNGFNGNQPLPLNATDGTPRTLQVGMKNKLYYFPDEASMWVALWLAAEARAKLGKTDVEPSKVYNKVRGGVAKNGNVVGVVHLHVEACAFDKIGDLWRGKLPDQATLILIHEPDPPAA